MSVRDYEELEAMKPDYLRHCFKSAKQNLVQGNAVDGDDFLNAKVYYAKEQIKIK